VLALGAYRMWFAPPTQEQIDRAVSAKDWPRVARLISRADLSGDRGPNYFRLGEAQARLGNREEATMAYMRADDLGFKRAEARFAIAVLYAQTGEEDLALRWLRDSMDAGLNDPARIESEPAFSSFSTPGWQETLEPVEEDAVLSGGRLEFLLGTWSLSRGSSGTSTVTISTKIDGSAILEEWTGTAPGGASGLYVFDEDARRWTYTWVDGYGRTFVGAVSFSKQVTVTGKLVFMDGMELARRIEIRRVSGAVEYVVTDSRDGGETWDVPDERRMTPVTGGARPSF
jgi:tetratricopeptide (TPR) repeat protein